LHHFCQIFSRDGEWQTAQGVIRAQLEDDYRRVMNFQGAW
jgi:hypothetical protein